MLHHRHYTVDEANRHLPAVGRIVSRLRDARRRLAIEDVDADFTTMTELTGGSWPGRAHAEAALEVSLGFDALEELDLVVRDLERGLIDFPSIIGGQEVYLCWIAGEATVGHWHAVGAGFAGRRPLT
jgi:hypothetical protein